METAAHVALGTRLSRFMQLQTLSEQDATMLCETCSDLVAFYDRQDEQQQQSSLDATADRGVPSLLGSSAVTSATMDDIVLLTTQKLLLGVVADSESRVKESVLHVLARTLARCEHQVHKFTEPKLFGFLQSCALYLPVPDAALERSAASTTSSTTNASEPQASRSLQSQSEELRLHVLTSLHLLFAPLAPLQQLAVDESLAPNSERAHFFAYVIASLLHIAAHDRCRASALLAIETLARVVAFVYHTPHLRQFFPGIAVGMWRTVNAPQQTSNVSAAALRCLALSITRCLGDAPTDDDAQADTAASALDTLPTNVELILTNVFQATQQRAQQQSWRVRVALVDVCRAVVLTSRTVLRASFFQCFEELLVLRVDAIHQVAASAQLVLDALQAALSTHEWLELVPVFADRVAMHLSTLALQSGTTHERSSVAVMRKVIGYVRFLGTRLQAHVDATIDAIYATLCCVNELDAIDMDLVLHQTLRAAAALVMEDDDNVGHTQSLTTSQFQKRLRFFHDQEAVDTVTQLLLALGSVITPALFIDCAFGLLQSAEVDTNRHAEVVLVLNGFLRAHTREHMRSNRDASNAALSSDNLNAATSSVDVYLVGRILDDLLALDAWHEHVTPNTTARHRRRNEQQTPQRRKSDVALRSLLVECIGVCVEILEADFHVFLLETLYPLVEKLGAHDVEVERAALTTLRKIAFFTSKTTDASLEALFEANMDYFVDALCARLAHLDAYPTTARVVEGLLRHTKIASLPLVDEVAHALLQSVDQHQQSRYIGSLLRALKLLLASMAAERDAISKAMEPEERSSMREPASQFGTALVLEPPGSLLTQFINEIRILTDEGTAMSDDDEEATLPSSIEEIHDSDENDDSDDADAAAKERNLMKGAMPVEFDEPSPIDSQADDAPSHGGKVVENTSPYMALILEILDRSGHFVAEAEPIACCLVLSMIDDGVLLLRDARTELLPLVARLWPAILPRLSVLNKPIVTVTVQLVTTLADVAGDFIGDRFVETVWPALRPHLRALNTKANSSSIGSGATTQLTRSMLLLSAPSSSDSVHLHSNDNDDAEAEPDAELDAGSQQSSPAAAAPRARRTLDSQLLLATLTCLATVCSKSSAVTQIVPDVAATCRAFLSAQFPRDVVVAAQTLFRALAALNGDEVFYALAPLAVWTPPAPPSAHFPAYALDATRTFYHEQLQQLGGGGGRSGSSNSSSAAAYTRANAAQLIAELQRHEIARQ